MVDLGPNAKDLVFNFYEAESTASKCDNAANDIDEQTSIRGHYEANKT